MFAVNLHPRIKSAFKSSLTLRKNFKLTWQAQCFAIHRTYSISTTLLDTKRETPKHKQFKTPTVPNTVYKSAMLQPDVICDKNAIQKLFQSAVPFTCISFISPLLMKVYQCALNLFVVDCTQSCARLTRYPLVSYDLYKSEARCSLVDSSAIPVSSAATVYANFMWVYFLIRCLVHLYGMFITGADFCSFCSVLRSQAIFY